MRLWSSPENSGIGGRCNWAILFQVCAYCRGVSLFNCSPRASESGDGIASGALTRGGGFLWTPVIWDVIASGPLTRGGGFLWTPAISSLSALQSRSTTSPSGAQETSCFGLRSSNSASRRSRLAICSCSCCSRRFSRASHFSSCAARLLYRCSSASSCCRASTLASLCTSASAEAARSSVVFLTSASCSVNSSIFRSTVDFCA